MRLSFVYDSVIMLFCIAQAINRSQKLVYEQNDLIKRFRGMQGTSDMLEVNKLQDRGEQEKAREKSYTNNIDTVIYFTSNSRSINTIVSYFCKFIR